MTKQQEIEKVKQLTKAADEQIKINEVGWTSRVYLIDDGRIVFKFPRSADAQEELRHEVNVLKLINKYDLGLKTQAVMWEGENFKYVGFTGVPGEALTPAIVGSLDRKQKEMLGYRLGTFLKKLHSVKGFENPNGTEQDQIDEYQEKYRKNRSVFEQYFNAEEMSFIDELFLVEAPVRIKELGNDLVFCHGDFGYNNILLDKDLNVGIIDFGDAGLNDRSVDFVDFDDETILNAALDVYGNDDNLREKIEIRQKTFPIYLMLFYIDRKDNEGIKQCVGKIKRIKEIEKVKSITGASSGQIELHDDGYWSRAYVVNGGEFVVKFPKHNSVSYENEASFLNLINDLTLPVNAQKVHRLSGDNQCIALLGVKGTPLSKIKNLTVQQKQNIGKQIGEFLKQLHSLKTDFGGQTLQDEINEYKKIYAECTDFFAKHFSQEECRALDYLLYTYLPAARMALGEKIVFCHADIWESNILIDDKGRAGIIDCANAGYFEEAADFVVEDEILRGFILDAYGASEDLRKKVEIKYDMSIITCPKFGIPLWGESVIIEKWIPLIRKVILKYKTNTSL